MFPERFVVRDVEVMKLSIVVVADQAGQVLKMLRFELDERRRAETMRLLHPLHLIIN